MAARLPLTLPQGSGVKWAQTHALCHPLPVLEGPLCLGAAWTSGGQAQPVSFDSSVVAQRENGVFREGWMGSGGPGGLRW